MGFGRECAELLANPSRSPEAPHFFAQSMALVLESLGSLDRRPDQAPPHSNYK